MQPTPNPLVNLAPIVAIFAIFYILLIRPQQKQQKTHEVMLKSLETGDKIITTGGLLPALAGQRTGQSVGLGGHY